MSNVIAKDQEIVRRILFLAFDYHPNTGGVAEYNSGLVEALCRVGCHVVVIAPRVSAETRSADSIATRTIRIGETDVNSKPHGILRRTLSTWKTRLELRQILRELQRDFSPDFAIVSPVSTWADALAKANIPYCLCVHGGDALGRRADLLRTLYRRRAVRSLLRGAWRTFANSDYTARELVNTLLVDGSERITTTYCGVAPEYFSMAGALSAYGTRRAGPMRILTVCRLVPFKACDVLINAIALLKVEYPSVFLTIAGDGPERTRLEELSNSLGLSDSIRFLGYVADRDDKAKLFLEHSIFVQSGRLDPRSARVENFGIVFAEAGAFCQAVIGPRIGGVPEVIEEGVTGLLAEPDNVDSLVEVLSKLLSDPELVQTMGKRGRERVEALFRYERIAESILEQFETTDAGQLATSKKCL
jgi:glycosyltransferase involved in cell wall biosynthesis